MDTSFKYKLYAVLVYFLYHLLLTLWISLSNILHSWEFDSPLIQFRSKEILSVIAIELNKSPPFFIGHILSDFDHSTRDCYNWKKSQKLSIPNPSCYKSGSWYPKRWSYLHRLYNYWVVNLDTHHFQRSPVLPILLWHLCILKYTSNYLTNMNILYQVSLFLVFLLCFSSCTKGIIMYIVSNAALTRQIYPTVLFTFILVRRHCSASFSQGAMPKLEGQLHVFTTVECRLSKLMISVKEAGPHSRRYFNLESLPLHFQTQHEKLLFSL